MIMTVVNFNTHITKCAQKVKFEILFVLPTKQHFNSFLRKHVYIRDE